MNRKQFLAALIIVISIDLALIITRIWIDYLNWTWIFIIILALYLFLRYKITGPLQNFATKFNLLVDYDLDIQSAKELCLAKVEDAPTRNIKAFYQVYLAMATYYEGEYEEAIAKFRAIELKKLNNIYHVLILSFIGYAAYELADMETFNQSIERIKNLQSTINKKYLGFVGSYLQVLEALQGINENPEHFKEVIEMQFSRNDGYISTKLIYNYRMAQYYQAIGDEKEMDIALAKVIANGLKHHTALQAKKMFKNTVNIDDYIFKEEEVLEEPLELTEESLEEKIEE